MNMEPQGQNIHTAAEECEQSHQGPSVLLLANEDSRLVMPSLSMLALGFWDKVLRGEDILSWVPGIGTGW